MEKNQNWQPYRQIKHARINDGLTQDELAELLAAHTGKTWTRDMVANVETGRKKLDWEGWAAFAEVQDRALEFYLIRPGMRVPGRDFLNPGQHKSRWVDLILPGQQPELAAA